MPRLSPASQSCRALFMLHSHAAPCFCFPFAPRLLARTHCQTQRLITCQEGRIREGSAWQNKNVPSSQPAASQPAISQPSAGHQPAISQPSAGHQPANQPRNQAGSASHPVSRQPGSQSQLAGRSQPTNQPTSQPASQPAIRQPPGSRAIPHEVPLSCHGGCCIHQDTQRVVHPAHI